MKRNIRKIYAAKTVIFLGIIHIVCGLITMRLSFEAHTVYIGDSQHLPIFFAVNVDNVGNIDNLNYESLTHPPTGETARRWYRS